LQLCSESILSPLCGKSTSHLRFCSIRFEIREPINDVGLSRTLYQSVSSAVNGPELLSFWTLSIFWYSENTRQHSVSETGPVSVLMWGGWTAALLGPLERATLNHRTTHVKVKVKVMLPPTVSRLVCLGVKHPFGT
jgi:hypothetical protein